MIEVRESTGAEFHSGEPGLTLLQFERLSREPRLVHAFTTRPQNYAPHRGHGRDGAVRSRQRVCGILGVSFEKLTSPEQTHGAEVLRVESGDVGRGHDGRASAMRFLDGLICDLPGVPLILMSADCPLVCVFDPERPAIGAVHSSWQGTVAHSTTRLVEQMVREFGSRPERLLAAICPSAGPCCYEVGDEVRRVARTRLAGADAFFAPCRHKFMLNLWEANRCQLIDAGVRPENIEVAGLCSICDERFWSHRRDGTDAGRSALFIGLRG